MTFTELIEELNKLINEENKEVIQKCVTFLNSLITTVSTQDVDGATKRDESQEKEDELDIADLFDEKGEK